MEFGWERRGRDAEAPRIFSGALFGGEFDVLEMVLREGAGLVHTHVIVEFNITVRLCVCLSLVDGALVCVSGG